LISKERVIRTGLLFALVNFAVAAILGSILRYNTIFPISGFNVRYWIHGHSHVAFLGWVFTALAVLGYALFLPDNPNINRKIYRLILFFQTALLGMLVTFPIMGYAIPSIIFSTVHMVLSLFYALLFFKYAPKKYLSVKFMKAALIFMLVSSFGPLALGPIMVMGFKGTPLYDMAIYFYLHFQYNGWFTLASFAILIRLAEDHGLKIQPRTGKLFFKLMVFSAILTLALSALGFATKSYVILVGLAGAVLQLWAGVLIIKFIIDQRKQLFRNINKWVSLFYGIALFSWFVKIIMQFLSAIPVLTTFAYANREAIMTYLHLSFLGFTSCFLIGVFISRKYLITNRVHVKTAYILFLISVILMLLTIGLKALPQLLTLEFFKILNISLLVESLVLLCSILMLIFFAFLKPNSKSLPH
jgi:hypothetical protein